MLLILLADPPEYNIKAIGWIIVALLGALFALYVRYRLAHDEIQVSISEFNCTRKFYYAGRVRIRQSTFAFTAHTVSQQTRYRPAKINVQIIGNSDEVEEKDEALSLIKSTIVEHEKQHNHTSYNNIDFIIQN